MSVILAEGHKCDFGLILEFMQKPADSEEISVLGEVLFYQEEPSLFKQFAFVFALIFELGDQHFSISFIKKTIYR
jgi:hypothetical protein